MAISQIGVKPKVEESGWDKISKVMGFASTAMSLGSNVEGLLSKPDENLAGIANTGVEKAPAAALKMDNPLLRRRYGDIA